jgi:(methylthio)acryloyl-CoA hydratase
MSDLSDSIGGSDPALSNGARTTAKISRPAIPERKAAHRGRPMARMLPNSLAASRRGDVSLLRLSRPAKRNALDPATIAGIESFFSRPPDGTRAIILYGEGEHFSAGADLSALTNAPASDRLHYLRSWHRAFDKIENGDVPVIAALRGAVIGGGLELAAAAHIRVAERSAYYALPESAKGIFVGGGGAVRIPRLIGTSRMIDMMLTGRTYRAEEGLALGFSQYVVDDGRALADALALAERIATNTTLGNFAMLQALPRIARADPDNGILTEALMTSLMLGDEETRTRLDAGPEKHVPRSSPLSGSDDS